MLMLVCSRKKSKQERIIERQIKGNLQEGQEILAPFFWRRQRVLFDTWDGGRLQPRRLYL
jgi:hypothetical protein